MESTYTIMTKMFMYKVYRKTVDIGDIGNQCVVCFV